MWSASHAVYSYNHDPEGEMVPHQSTCTGALIRRGVGGCELGG